MAHTYSLVSPEVLLSLIEKGESFELLDVRSDGERRNIPFFEAKALDSDLESDLEKLPRDKALIFVCYRGVRSAKTAQQYVDLGFTHVYSLEGGVEAYVKKLGRPPLRELAA